MLNRTCIVIWLALLVPPVQAVVTLPAIFSDHMVLQRDAGVPVWGWADRSEQVVVTIAGQSKSTTADASGKWSVKLDALMGGPHTLVIKGSNTITINDVLIGEVWLCSGQSNMARTVAAALNFDQERAAANFPMIRTFREDSPVATEPQEKCTGKWVICSPQTAGEFSAVAYFFGREIHQKNNAPVGLINSSVGGTMIEAWISMDAQAGKPEMKRVFDRWDRIKAAWKAEVVWPAYEKKMAEWTPLAEKAKAEGTRPPPAPRKPIEPRLEANHPANLFNGKIAPLIPYAIRGCIWYQGEGNEGQYPDLYGEQLQTLISDWRARWGHEFPFAWVQLPEIGPPQKAAVEEVGRVVVREEMRQALNIPKTGMAIALGTGEEKDNHPKNKQAVGKRLAMWALADVYGMKDVAASGPLYRSHEIQGDTIAINFAHAHAGLVAQGGGELKGFAIAGKDMKWQWGTATIDGEKVIVSHSDIKEPFAVRYAWSANPATANLYNGAGIPASPFRTDTPPPSVKSER